MKNNNNIAILSFLTENFKPLQEITGPNKQKYCDKWGYKHIVKYAPYGNPDNYYALARIEYLRDLLFSGLEEGKGIDTILVMNTHSIITNFTIPIESLMDDNYDWFMAKDVSGVQMGLYIVRKSEWLKKWLDFILDHQLEINQKFQFEQTFVAENWEKPEWKEKIQIIPQEQLGAYIWKHYGWDENSQGAWKRGAFSAHIPGRSILSNPAHNLLQTRVEIFSSQEVKDMIIY